MRVVTATALGGRRLIENDLVAIVAGAAKRPSVFVNELNALKLEVWHVDGHHMSYLRHTHTCRLQHGFLGMWVKMPCGQVGPPGRWAATSMLK